MAEPIRESWREEDMPQTEAPIFVRMECNDQEIQEDRVEVLKVYMSVNKVKFRCPICGQEHLSTRS